MSDTSLRAPFGGWITARNVERGSLVGNATVGFSIVDTHVVKANFAVPDTSLKSIRLGQKLTVLLDALTQPVRGIVTDKTDSPLSGSVVFLKNLRTNSVRSSYTDDTGNYRFSGLDPNADYELHAEREGSKSPTRTVSSFDSRKDIVLNLKIDKKKG